MERNNLKKITGNRWFLPVVCAVSFVFGWWYLSITTCAPLGGDDEIINLQNYYYITHTPWWQVVLTHAKEILNQLALQSPRFRPFSSPPVRSLNSWFLGDLVVYRLYILAWTYADITLTAWLTAKATHSKKLGALAFCLLPMMFSLWQDATGNSMYSYGALAQSTLLPVLLAGLCMLRWQDTKHLRWAVFSAFWMFMACGTFEIGFTYIAALFGFAWLYTGSGKMRPALRLCLAPLAGEIISFGFNMGSRAVNAMRDTGATDIGGISPNFDLPLVLRTWVMQMSAGFPLNAMIFGKIKPSNVQPSDVICGIALAICVVAALAVLDRLPTRKENLLLFLTGLALLSAPSLLIGLSPKYQDGINVDWRHGYIPQTVESFGVGLMAVAVFVVLLRFVRGKNWWPKLRPVCSVLLAAGMAFSVVWQRSAARSYEKGGRAYTVFAEGAEAGLADAAGTETPVVTDYPVWGGDLEAENAFFLRYADTDTNAHSLAVWRTESHDEATVCRLGFALGSDKRTDISWLGTAADDNLDTVTGVTVYLPKQADPAGTLAYTTRAADGTETEHTQPLAELAQTKAENGGTLVTLPETAPIVGDTLRLQSWIKEYKLT